MEGLLRCIDQRPDGGMAGLLTSAPCMDIMLYQIGYL